MMLYTYHPLKKLFVSKIFQFNFRRLFFLFSWTVCPSFLLSSPSPTNPPQHFLLKDFAHLKPHPFTWWTPRAKAGCGRTGIYPFALHIQQTDGTKNKHNAKFKTKTPRAWIKLWELPSTIMTVSTLAHTWTTTHQEINAAPTEEPTKNTPTV